MTKVLNKGKTEKNITYHFYHSLKIHNQGLHRRKKIFILLNILHKLIQYLMENPS